VSNWVDPDKDPRDSGKELTDERSTLLEYLRAYRLTLEMKCADLDPEQMARRSVPPSPIRVSSTRPGTRGVKRSISPTS
jgi:hypothetical protein